MRFLIDADLPRSTAGLIQSYGHDATDVRDIGLGNADDAEIAARAKSDRVGLCTGDFGFADVRNYPPQDYAGIVVFEIPSWATAPFILALVRSFFEQLPTLGDISGKLIIVAPGRIRVRTGGP
jgi:hypothetical protein